MKEEGANVLPMPITLHGTYHQTTEGRFEEHRRAIEAGSTDYSVPRHFKNSHGQSTKGLSLNH